MAHLRRRASPVFMLLFALPFLGVGLFMGGLTLRTVQRAQAVSHWMEAPATVLETDLQEHHGDDSTTYRVTARFRYEVNGQAYESTRVGLQGGSDNIGSWQQDRYRELVQVLQVPDAVRCRVNPADPAEAVLFPQARAPLLFLYGAFSFIFGGVGLGVGVAAVRAWRSAARAAAAPETEPWRQRDDWAQGVIRSSSRAEAWVLTAMAVFWNVISWSFVVAAGRDFFRSGVVALFLLLFPAIGVALAVWAVRQQIAAARYGRAVFQMAAVPGVLGGRLAGVIRLPGSDRPEGGFVVTVQCQRTVRQGKGSTTVTDWQAERALDPGKLPLVDEGQALPVLFALPYDRPASGEWTGGGPARWRLQVKGAQPGVDVDVSFEIPVFRTADSRPDFALDDRPVAAFEPKA